MKSSEPNDTSIDSSEKKSSQNKPVLFTIESPNKKLLKKKRFKVRTKKEEGDKETSNICLRYGYWSKLDHTKFIEALYLYENDWTRIQEYVNDRTDKQVHSHAQKFFLRLKTFKDEKLGLDFTSSNVKCLDDIIYLIKQKESVSGNCGKLLHIISEKISFGKKPLKKEQEILAKKNEKKKLNTFNYKNQISNNFNNFNNVNQMNYQKLLINKIIMYKQFLIYLNFINLSSNINNNFVYNFGNN